MAGLISTIAVVRESVAAILRVHQARPERVKKDRVRPAEYQVSVCGTAFCIVQDRYLVTAYHVLNSGKPRDPQDNFYALVVPGNGNPSFIFPVISYPHERPDIDIAVIEIGACTTSGVQIPSIPVTFTLQTDGSRVITVGFPGPEITGVRLDGQGNFLGGQFLLKSHANEGIVSAQYVLNYSNAGGKTNSVPIYELNVAWHHGESGGPIATLTEPASVFSLMQRYRNIQSPYGIVAGPHFGCALFAFKQELTGLGATIV